MAAKTLYDFTKAQNTSFEVAVDDAEETERQTKVTEAQTALEAANLVVSTAESIVQAQSVWLKIDEEAAAIKRTATQDIQEARTDYNALIRAPANSESARKRSHMDGEWVRGQQEAGWGSKPGEGKDKNEPEPEGGGEVNGGPRPRNGVASGGGNGKPRELFAARPSYLLARPEEEGGVLVGGDSLAYSDASLSQRAGLDVLTVLLSTGSSSAASAGMKDVNMNVTVAHADLGKMSRAMVLSVKNSTHLHAFMKDLAAKIKAKQRALMSHAEVRSVKGVKLRRNFFEPP